MLDISKLYYRKQGIGNRELATCSLYWCIIQKDSFRFLFNYKWVYTSFASVCKAFNDTKELIVICQHIMNTVRLMLKENTYMLKGK